MKTGFTHPDQKIKKYSLDLEDNVGTKFENAVIGNSEEKKREFLCGILFNDFSLSGGETNFESNFKVLVGTDNGCQSLYDQLKDIGNDKIITESLGVYYQNDNPNEPDVNKTKKRVITYTIKDREE